MHDNLHEWCSRKREVDPDSPKPKPESRPLPDSVQYRTWLPPIPRTPFPSGRDSYSKATAPYSTFPSDKRDHHCPPHTPTSSEQGHGACQLSKQRKPLSQTPEKQRTTKPAPPTSPRPNTALTGKRRFTFSSEPASIATSAPRRSTPFSPRHPPLPKSCDTAVGRPGEGCPGSLGRPCRESSLTQKR